MGRKREHLIDDNYFNVIDTHKKAYILGFLYADGSINNNGFSIIIHKRDIKILEFIKKEIKTDYLINPHYDDYIRFQIVSSEIRKNLITIGVIPNKTYKSKDTPLLYTPKLFNSFLCGFFDGDGSISSSKYKNRSKEYTISFSGNIWVLTQIKNYLYSNNISSSKIRYRRPSDYSCQLEIRGTNNIKKMFHLLYDNNDFIHTRKFIKFNEFLDNRKLLKQRISTETINKIKNDYINGLKQFQIGEKMNIPKSSVRAVVQRLRKNGEVN